MTQNLEQLLAEPIQLPKSPFWEITKEFGRDELISAAFNLLGTAGTEHLLLGSAYTEETKKLVLTFAGPVIEKIGFFPAHFYEARQSYNEDLPSERKPYKEYLKTALRGGAASLAKDIAIHDPLYGMMMYGGLSAYPGTPAWLLAAGSFALSVLAVGGLEVGYHELQYHRFQHKLKQQGFKTESYYESRFLFPNSQNPQQIINRVATEFNLEDQRQGPYHDQYIEHTLPEFNNRKARLRLRHRQLNDGQNDTLQVVYTRASELQNKNPEQFRFFPTHKVKLYHPLSTTTENVLTYPDEEEIAQTKAENPFIQTVLGEYSTFNPAGEKVFFDRQIARNDTLLITIDQVPNREFYVVELKVREDTDTLKQAMRLVMRDFAANQTTLDKYGMFTGQ